MYKGKILAVILAGGAGGRLGILTDKKAKPVMPFGGFYRLIDFPLSHCLHSGITDVWVIEQYELHTLNEHLSSGRPWDLDKTYGGLKILPPFENDENKEEHGGGFAHGNADAIAKNRKLIKEFDPDILIVLSADHIYKIDFRDVLETHLDKKAAVTMVTTKLPKGESASRFGVVEVNKNGKIINFQYKPDKPKSDLITTEIFVYDAKILLRTLDELTKEQDKIEDYGDQLLPKLVKEEKAFEHRYKGFWRDVGTIKSYWQTQIDLLDENINFSLDDEDWAILTKAKQSVPAFIYKNADVKNSLVSQGCKIYGQVEHSILSANVTVEKGAKVKDSVLLPGSSVEENIKIEKVIVDTDARVTKHKIETLEKMRKQYKNDIFIIGKCKVQAESEIDE